MRYASLKAHGCTIGSGVVEAANKVLVNQRMKRAGMRWSIEGGQNVLTLRALIRSDRFELAWRLEPRTKRRTPSPLDGEIRQ